MVISVNAEKSHIFLHIGSCGFAIVQSAFSL
jgi:hypothetical protein